MKYVIDGKEIILPDNLGEGEVLKELEKRLKNQNLKRPLVMRKSNGSSSKLLNGVRLHGKRH